MTTLNLTANGKAQELILAYLQENASDVLAEKINNGVTVEKDGKTLISKKDLDGFMKFATDEARKLAEKGANSACVEDAVVYGWAIHYFEEDTIEGKLYNEDGTEYKPTKPVVKKTTTPTPIVKAELPKPKQQQASLWDMLDVTDKKTETEQTDDHEIVDDADDDCEPTEEEIQETMRLMADENGITKQPDDEDEPEPTVEQIADALQKAVDEKNGVKVEPVAPKKPIPPFYSQYVELKDTYPDCIILIRLGDFYESFNDDAQTLSDELNLTLTGRDVGLEQRVPIIGFPYHAADTYIAKIRKNHDVVIVEVNGNIVPLQKTGTPLIKDDLPDEEEEIEELTETEMRQFDGDIAEPKVTVDEEPDDDNSAPYSPSSFDKETMIYLYDLLDGKLDIA